MPLAKKIIPATMAALAMAGALTACSITNPPTKASGAPEATASTPAASATAEMVTDVKTQPGVSQGYAGALKDVTVTNCNASNNPSTFSGTVKNPETTSQSYRIYVSLVNNGKTIGLSEVDVNDVAAGAQAPWQGTLATGASGTQCVLRVERTPA